MFPDEWGVPWIFRIYGDGSDRGGAGSTGCSSNFGESGGGALCRCAGGIASALLRRG
jgi:hypothetical protein